MSVIIQGTQLRDISLGRYTQGKTSTLAAGGGTHQVFTVAGGEVLITALWAKCTEAIALAAVTLSVQVDPTTGTTKVITEATDIGTTDTAVGDVVGFVRSIDDPATNGVSFEYSASLNGADLRFIATTGEIEAVFSDETGTEDGELEWYATWVPLTPGATVVASA